jgi:hypothetical protein
MWASFPIQTSSGGVECSMIDKGFQYTRYPEVTVSQWKDVSNKQYFLDLWKEIFGMRRCPLTQDDMVGYIPQKGTIVAKYGYWVGHDKSRQAVYINCLFVEKGHRKEGIATKLIQSITFESCKRWGSIPFFFEVEEIPLSLIKRNAEPVCRYSYVWIPFIGGDIQWKTTSLDILKNMKGFHSFEGWQAYTDGTDYIVFDSNDDIVWYSSVWCLPFFNGFLTMGAHCRVVGWGGSAVFAENMYFTPKHHHYLF